MSKICICAAPLPCQQALQMLYIQHNAMQMIVVQNVWSKICTVQLCIQKRVRTQIRMLHVAQSMIIHLLHLQLHAAVLYVWHNTRISMAHCNQAMPSTKATQNQSEHSKTIFVLK